MSRHKHELRPPAQSAVRTLSAAQRRSMIAEAAHFLAGQRGFQGGEAVQDWLQAEGEIALRRGETVLHQAAGAPVNAVRRHDG